MSRLSNISDYLIASCSDPMYLDTDYLIVENSNSFFSDVATIVTNVVRYNIDYTIYSNVSAEFIHSNTSHIHLTNTIFFIFLFLMHELYKKKTGKLRFFVFYFR